MNTKSKILWLNGKTCYSFPHNILELISTSYFPLPLHKCCHHHYSHKYFHFHFHHPCHHISSHLMPPQLLLSASITSPSSVLLCLKGFLCFHLSTLLTFFCTSNFFSTWVHPLVNNKLIFSEKIN